MVKCLIWWRIDIERLRQSVVTPTWISRREKKKSIKFVRYHRILVNQEGQMAWTKQMGKGAGNSAIH